MTAAGPLLWLLAQAATPAAAPPAAAPPAAAPPAEPVQAPAAAPPPAETVPAPAPPPPPPPAPPPRAAPSSRPPPLPPSMATPFRLSLTYLRVLREDGELATSNTTNAIGFDMAFPSNNYVRNHLGVAHQWESAGPYSARGFRIDLISLGYPINLYTSPTSSFRFDLEPVITVLRGELMFVTGGGRLLRVESGFGLELSATVRHWFVTLQAFGIDFRYWVYASEGSFTGFTRVIPLRVAIGHEF